MTIHHVLSTRRTKCYTVCLTLMFLLTCRQLKAQWFLSDLHTFLLPIAPDFNSMMILDWKFFCMSLHVTASVWTVSQPLAMTVEQKWSNMPHIMGASFNNHSTKRTILRLAIQRESQQLFSMLVSGLSVSPLSPISVDCLWWRKSVIIQLFNCWSVHSLLNTLHQMLITDGNSTEQLS